MRTVGLRFAAGLVATGLLIGGCGGSPEPSPTPKPAKSTSPTASAKPTAPVMPEAARAKTKAGAIAFARVFIETLNYAGEGADTKPLRRLYISLCTRCEAIADGIDRTYSLGGKIRGGKWHPTRFKFYAIRNQVAVVDAWVDYDAQTWIKKREAAPTNFPATKRHLKAFNLRWTGSNGWAVSALDPTA